MSIGVPVTKSFNKLKKYPYEINKFDRRETNEYFYLPVDCPRMKKCDDAYCPLAHTKLEKIFHPIVYKTQACQMAKDGACDYFQKCAFYHDSNDKNEAHLNWTIWEKKWDKWRNNIDSILTQHNKNDKEIRRKVESILKIRMPHFNYTTNKNNLFLNKSTSFHSTWPSLNNNNSGISNMEIVDIGNMGSIGTIGSIGQTGNANNGSNIMESGSIGNAGKLSNINNILCKSMNSALFQYSSSIFNNAWSKGINGNKKHIKNNNDNKNSNIWWLNQINEIGIVNLDKNVHNINENNINKNNICCDETLSYNSNNGTECGVNYDILDNNAYKIVEFCFTDYDNNNNSNNNNINSNKNKIKWRDTTDASNGQSLNSFFSQNTKGLSNDINYLQNANNNNNYNNQRNNIFQCINYNKTCEYIPNIQEGIDDNKNKKYNTLETNYRDNFLADMNNSNKNFDFINSTFFSNSSNDITGAENYVNFPTMLEIIDDDNNAVKNNVFSTGNGTTTNNYNNENDNSVIKNNENDNDCNGNITNTTSYTDGFSAFYNNNTGITIDNNIKDFPNLDNCKTFDNFNFDDTIKNNISNLIFSGEDKEHIKEMKIKKENENIGNGNANDDMKGMEKELEENNEAEDNEIKGDAGVNTGNILGSGNSTKGVNRSLKKNKNKKGTINNATSNNTESMFSNNIGDEESKNSSIINSSEVKTDINDKKKNPKKENRNSKNSNSEKDQYEKGGSKKILSCVSKIGSNNGNVSVNENACLENEKNKSTKCKNNENNNNKKGAYSKNTNINGDKNMSKVGKKNITENFVSSNNDDADNKNTDKKNVEKNKTKNIEKNKIDNRDNTWSIQLNRKYSDVLGENIINGNEWNNTIKCLDKSKGNDNLINNSGKADKRKTNNNNVFSNSINKRELENDINNDDNIIVENYGLSLIYNSYYNEKVKLENKKKNIIVDIENVNSIENNNVMVNEKGDNNNTTERCKNNTDVLCPNTPSNNNLFKYDQNLLINRGDNKNENVDRNMSSHMKESFCDYTNNNENKHDGNSILTKRINTEYIFNNVNNIKNSSDINYINSKDNLFVFKTIEYNKPNNETIEDSNRGIYNNYIINDVDSSINVENKSAHLENINNNNTDSTDIKEDINRNNVMENIRSNNSERINDTLTGVLNNALNGILNGALDRTMDSIFKIDTTSDDTYNELFNTLTSNSNNNNFSNGNNSGHNSTQNDEIKENITNNGQTNESFDYTNNLLNIFLSCNSINENFDITNSVNTNFYENNKSDTIPFNNSDKFTPEIYGVLNNSSNYFNIFGNYNLYGSTCMQCKHYKNEIKNLISQIKVLREEIIKYKQVIITYGINANKDNTLNPCNYKWDNSKKFNGIYEKNYISSVEAND
ncbi:conserved Plasmodium protein, unknown function [Plasmodium berghei]|uniref:Zinc finger protein, putative n=2 Tax=Plasmodium berghei TaxID=5821 RepID=A0A509ABF0_PLABA|nr:zinc finger protein, putative [Plasmodium berghei ANKA]SCM18952.1 conserved Plasmodium protein, unknown function [Plasmodium berghei]SCN21504.1 conserved Plasmodium protein, unknown function [Plasmodium berghei]SCO58772.1 conserved Plasmodium protein, unknown function [Plasmodium berghei]VUC53744.1 zinc finger protein, putative [Plasmodium berghei ANKA]|eukprot:XP_034419608.1 zinc finger protein, putative [Plasmodium berghei ANKA]